ncbi:unnamed protein product [Symbiodinium natans]|nr:unnamed protein product [Symbiodinium natans]
MDSAKALEVDNWMKTMAVKAAKKFVPQKELLRMRWVLTFKSSSEADAVQGTPPSQDCVKAKARIVILGYSDPHLLDASSVSPAMSRLSTGAERLTTDSCVWRIRAWSNFLQGFKGAYEWSPWEYGAFKHCGVQIVQHPDFSVSIDHSSFCSELKQMTPIKETRKLHPEELSQVRAILGSIQWRVYQSAPQHAAKLNYLQSLVAVQDSSMVEQVNKLVREVFAARSLSCQVQALGADNPDDLCMIGWSDASLANRPDFSSTGGYLIALMSKKAIQDGMGRVNPVSWRSGKLRRVARSSLSAESQALADAEQELFYARSEWREMMGDDLGATKPEEVSKRMQGYLVVDAKAMFDTLSKGVLAASQKDKYTGLELLARSQHLEAQQTTLLWCDSDHQLADGLTKASKQDVLKRFLSSGMWRIRYDGAYVSAKKRRQMIHEEEEGNSTFLLDFVFRTH